MVTKKLTSTQPAKRKIKRILCTVDLSCRDGQAIRYGAALADKFSATLTICHCYKADEKIDQNYLIEILKERLNKEVAPAILEKLHWKCEIIACGVDELANIAIEEQADLIVMSSRRRYLFTTLLGSNAETLFHSAPCPVLVLHADEREFINDKADNLTLLNLLVAFDFSKGAVIALDYAIFIAKQLNATLHLLYVFPLNANNLWAPPTEEQIKDISQRLFNTLPASFRETNNFQIEIREGDPASTIIHYACEYEIDLVCLGAHSEDSIWSYLFGTTVDNLVPEISCPILVARNASSMII